MLNLKFNIKEIDEVSNCNELVQLFKQNDKAYTHLILDIQMSDGSTLELIAGIIKIAPTLQIMIHSMQPEPVYKANLLQMGVFGFVSKNAGEDLVIDELNRFVNTYATPRTLKKVNAQLENPLAKFTNRELQVLHYLKEGKSTGEIADLLSVSDSMISMCKKKILTETNTSNVKELTDLVALHGMPEEGRKTQQGKKR
ncbi:DNA-binding NarL/FixJ family response regulator [Dinghuibacter silviterrae]|uniref:DNA-binding NarL/FixJ family response regulator n=2 Tax=Dinghuibacter silviterrae TaxID=1539049 RepID=A0A4R8DHD3_9BACT|nr:DNA-binding NarL/FixJ family response regulator [Dinghuibacter silviterrae]